MNFLSLKYLLLEWKLENYIAWKMILWETKLRKVLDWMRYENNECNKKGE